MLEAKNVITKGNVYQLGHVYEPGMPMYGTRHYSLRIPQAFKMPGKNEAVYHDEVISGELGQIGTQFDGLGHLGMGDLFYNGNRRSEFAQEEGLIKLGIENVGAIVTRGVLIDVAKFKGVDQLPPRYEITPADIKGALQREGVQIKSGDMVIIHTGWGSLWMKDNAKYGDSEPGIGLAAGQMLVDAEVVVVGADTWGLEAVPFETKNIFEVHQILLPMNGTYILENMNTAELAKDKAYEFMFVLGHPRFKGGVQSMINPVAIR